MLLPADCFPCPPAIARAMRHIAHSISNVSRRATRPLRHPMRHIAHHIMRHPGKITIAVCCAGAIGPGGGALSAPPTNSPAAIYAPPPTPTWPEIPSYSGGSGYGPGGIYGGGASAYGLAPSASNNSSLPALIPVYSATPPSEIIPTQPPTVRLPSSPTHVTSIPEPASFALLLLPAGVVIAIRRRTT